MSTPKCNISSCYKLIHLQQQWPVQVPESVQCCKHKVISSRGCTGQQASRAGTAHTPCTPATFKTTTKTASNTPGCIQVGCLQPNTSFPQEITLWDAVSGAENSNNTSLDSPGGLVCDTCRCSTAGRNGTSAGYEPFPDVYTKAPVCHVDESWLQLWLEPCPESQLESSI
jgi:hypothetical protein